MPVLVIPLLSTLAIGAIMLIVVGKPITVATNGLTDFLNGLTGSNAILLGVLLGLMMGFDLGGPVNKVAYVFATVGLAAAGNATTGAPLEIMAAVMAAGMVPPLGLALATVVRKRLFTPAERGNGKAAWLLGASFITEGADRWTVHGLRRYPPRPARRHLRGAADRQPLPLPARDPRRHPGDGGSRRRAQARKHPTVSTDTVGVTLPPAAAGA